MVNWSCIVCILDFHLSILCMANHRISFYNVLVQLVVCSYMPAWSAVGLHGCGRVDITLAFKFLDLGSIPGSCLLSSFIN